MKPLLFALVVLSLTSLNGMAQMSFGKFHLFEPVDSIEIPTSEFGQILGRAEGEITRYEDGGKEKGIFETYDINSDSSSDLYIIKRESDKLISIGIDTTSIMYDSILIIFKGRIRPQAPIREPAPKHLL